MIKHVFYRLWQSVLSLLVISFLVFIIIKLPDGDYLTNQIAELESSSDETLVAKANFLRHEFSLDKSVLHQYMIWVGLLPSPHGFNGLLQGNSGWSFEYEKPVNEIIGNSLSITILLNLLVIGFVHIIAIPIALYSAQKPYSLLDYGATLFGYIGLAVPNFLLSLLLLFYLNRWFGISIGGLGIEEAASFWQNLKSFSQHMIAPIIVIGLSSTAGLIRRMRANLLDEMGRQYMVTARAKGLTQSRATFKYAFRISLNPFIADVGNIMPQLVSGSVLVSLVLSLPTVGPILLQALRSQDQFLAAFILMFVAVLTVVGMVVSDLILYWIDPRIKKNAEKN